MAPVLAAIENENKWVKKIMSKNFQQPDKYINEFWKNLANGDGKNSEEILREFVKSAAERMKSDDVIDDVEKVMEKFKLLQSKLEGEFGELVARAKKVKVAKEKATSIKKHVEEKNRTDDIKIVSKKVRRIR